MVAIPPAGHAIAIVAAELRGGTTVAAAFIRTIRAVRVVVALVAGGDALPVRTFPLTGAASAALADAARTCLAA